MTIGHYFLLYLAGYFVCCFVLTKFIVLSSSPPKNDDESSKAVLGILVLSFAWPIVVVFWIGIYAAVFGLNRKTKTMVRTTMKKEK